MTNLVIAAQKTPSQMRTETTLGYTANGVGAITGPQAGATFTDIIDSYIPFLHSSSNCFWRSNGLSTAANCEPIVNESVASNALLKSESLTGKSVGYTIFRQGFSTPGDGGGLIYYLSGAACSISGGNDFTQVAPTVGTGCWLAVPQPNGYDIRAAGMVSGDSTTNAATNSAIMTKIFAEPTGPKILVPAGTNFRLACGTQWVATAGLKFEGTGTIKLNPGCSYSGTVMNWLNVSGGHINGVTFDLNNPANPGAAWAFIAVRAHAATVDGFIFENGKVLNGGRNVYEVVGSALSGNTLKGFVVRNSYFTAVSSTGPDACVLLSTVNNAGIILKPLVENTTCVGTTIQLDGTNPIARFNDVSAFEYGSGIFTASMPALPYNANECILEGNYIHDTGAGLDVNNTAHEGFEDHCDHTFATNNRFVNLGGSAIVIFGNYATYVGNSIYGAGKGFSAGLGTRNGIWIVKAASPDPNAGANVTLIGNTIEDDGSSDGGSPDTPALLAAIRVESNLLGAVQGHDNVVRLSSKVDANGHLLATSVAYASNGPSISSDLVKYSNVQRTLNSAVSSFSWGPLDTVAFKNWTLDCSRIFPSVADFGQVQVSQDGAQTWKTTGTYVTSGSEVANGARTNLLTTTGTGMQIGATNWATNQSKNAKFKLHCRNLDGTLDRKSCVFYDMDARRQSDNANFQTDGSAYWNGDSNPVDGFRFLMAGGNTFQGSCTLKGELP